MKKLVALAAAGVLVVGGVAAAATGVIGGGTTIQACVASNGDLSVAPAKGCKKNDDPLSWNTVGPQGPAGPQGQPGEPGAAGAPGAQGERGPSDAWVASTGATDFGDPNGQNPLDVTAFTLPAGSYVLNGSIDLRNTYTSTGDYRCTVQYEGRKGTVEAIRETRVTVPVAGEAVMPLAGAVELNGDTELHVWCRAASPNGGEATAWVQLTATQVATLHR
jgi:hypothetical protein